jgi:hypothetical protein
MVDSLQLKSTRDYLLKRPRNIEPLFYGAIAAQSHQVITKLYEDKRVQTVINHDEALDFVIRKGYDDKETLDLVKMIIEKSKVTVEGNRESFVLAALKGYVHTLKFFLNTLDIPIKTVRFALLGAASKGHLETVKYLTTPNIEPEAINNAFINAAQNGRLLVLKYLWNKVPDSVINQGFVKAGLSGKAKIVKAMMKYTQISKASMKIVLERTIRYFNIGDNKNITRIVLEASKDVQKVGIEIASTCNNVQVIEMLTQSKQGIDEALECAASTGNLPLISRFLVDSTDKGIVKAFMTASKNRQLDGAKIIIDKMSEEVINEQFLYAVLNLPGQVVDLMLETQKIVQSNLKKGLGIARQKKSRNLMDKIQSYIPEQPGCIIS